MIIRGIQHPDAEGKRLDLIDLQILQFIGEQGERADRVFPVCDSGGKKRIYGGAVYQGVCRFKGQISAGMIFNAEKAVPGMLLSAVPVKEIRIPS